ncbi:MAG: NADH-quinone oxidoreductase subunit NuoH [Candidatus Omnitrophota bacterium]|jgi:NADH-quinone oxidoreductase subunit H|nr:MAG: NADH-quinone oxidoreductase subunit NuoH [Candidatus Omnitrophota bacterium]
MNLGELALYSIVKIAILFPLVMLSVAYLTWLERKLLGRFQQRLGPHRVGPFGLLQPIADGVKLFFKEDIIPTNADRILFILAPVLSMACALMAIAVIPFGPSFQLFGYDLGRVQIADVNVGLLYIFGITSLSVYGVFLAGWSSGNKYSLLGALRSSAQIFSYELTLGLSVIIPLMAVGSLKMSGIVDSQADGFWNWWILSPKWLVIPGLLGFALYLISAFAETNRIPFDLPEAETELVAGYHLEYSSMKFAMFFMAEYVNMITAASIATTLFLGGWHSPLPLAPFTWFPGWFWFAAKVFVILFFFIWVRATFPRFRYDQLMHFGWKILLPLAMLNVFLAAVGLLLAG